MLLARAEQVEQAEMGEMVKIVLTVMVIIVVVVIIGGQKTAKVGVLALAVVVVLEELLAATELVARRIAVGLAMKSDGLWVQVVVELAVAVAMVEQVEQAVPGNPEKIIRFIHPPALRKAKTGMMSAVMLAVVPEEVEVLGAELMVPQMEQT